MTQRKREEKSGEGRKGKRMRIGVRRKAKIMVSGERKVKKNGKLRFYGYFTKNIAL